MSRNLSRRRSRQAPTKLRHPANLLGPWGVVALALAVAMGASITLGISDTGLPRGLGFVVGAAVALLTVGGLPSIPTNAAVFAVLSSGGFVLLRWLVAGLPRRRKPHDEKVTLPRAPRSWPVHAGRPHHETLIS